MIKELLRADLKSTSSQLATHKAENGLYPIDSTGLKFSSGTDVEYSSNPYAYCLNLISTKYSDIVFSIDQDGEVKDGACPEVTADPTDPTEPGGPTDPGEPEVATPESCFSYSNWSSDSTKVQINEYREDQSGCTRKVVIPATLGGKPVGAIAYQGFHKVDLTSIYIPDSVIDLAAESFYKNLLTSLTLGNSVVSIGTGAFDDNNSIVCRVPTGRSFSASSIRCKSIVYY